MREVVLDTETTGLSYKAGHKIIEIGCIELQDLIPTGKVFHQYINPQSKKISPVAMRIHGITNDMVADKPTFKDIANKFLNFVQDSRLIIHNAHFDIGFLNHELSLINKPVINEKNVVDTLLMSRKIFPGSPASLDSLCKRFNISLNNRKLHGALLDSKLLSLVYLELSGGSQVSFNLKKDIKVKQNQKNVYHKIDTERESFFPSDEEINKHKNFLSLIKNSIWKKHYNE